MSTKEQKFFNDLIDFTKLKDMSDVEIEQWALDKWDQLGEYLDIKDPNFEFSPHIQLFITYMGRYIPELNSDSGSSD